MTRTHEPNGHFRQTHVTKKRDVRDSRRRPQQQVPVSVTRAVAEMGPSRRQQPSNAFVYSCAGALQQALRSGSDDWRYAPSSIRLRARGFYDWSPLRDFGLDEVGALGRRRADGLQAEAREAFLHD